MQKLIELKKEISGIEEALVLLPPNKVVINFYRSLLAIKGAEFSKELVLLAIERSYAIIPECHFDIDATGLLRHDHISLCRREIKAELDQTK